MQIVKCKLNISVHCFTDASLVFNLRAGVWSLIAGRPPLPAANTLCAEGDDVSDNADFCLCGLLVFRAGRLREAMPELNTLLC